MPDLITHIGLGHLLKRSSPWSEDALFFAAGSALPDLVSRGPVVALLFLEYFTGLAPPDSFLTGLTALHSPIPYVFVCLNVAFWVDVQSRRAVFRNILISGEIHILLDCTQKHIDQGQLLFFPFSWSDYELGWFSTEDSLYAAPFVILLAIGIEWRHRVRLRRQYTAAMGAQSSEHIQ